MSEEEEGMGVEPEDRLTRFLGGLRPRHVACVFLVVFAGFAAVDSFSQEPVLPVRAACRVQAEPVVIDYPAKDAAVVEHAQDAIRRGQPEFLTLDRYRADENRAESLRGRPKVPGMDLDEYPPASADQGGPGADVLPIDLHVNRSAGSIMGAQLRGFCDGQVFRFERSVGEL